MKDLLNHLANAPAEQFIGALVLGIVATATLYRIIKEIVKG